MEETILENGVRVSLTPSIGADGLTAFVLLCWLNKAMALIPYEFRKSATVDFCDDHDNDAYFQVSYIRDHTEEESAEIAARNLRYQDVLRDGENERRQQRERDEMSLFQNIRAITAPEIHDATIVALMLTWSDEERRAKLKSVRNFGYI